MWVLKLYITPLERAIKHFPCDNLTCMRMLAQNDPLEWTRRIGRLPHDDARTHKSLEKMSAPRRLQLPTPPP